MIGVGSAKSSKDVASGAAGAAAAGAAAAGVLLAGAGSRRGGGVSGLGGYHAARAVLAD